MKTMNNFKFKSVFGPLPSSMIPKLAPVSLPAPETKKGNGLLVTVVVIAAVAGMVYLVHRANKKEEERRKT
jgi:hypothetical protein